MPILPEHVLCVALVSVLFLSPAHASTPLLHTPERSMPERASSATPDSTYPAPQAFDLQGHRGARGLLPENTIPAFRRALELGVTTLEMDVVITQDGEVVVSHEPWMSSVICMQPSGEPIPEDEEQAFNIYRMPYSEVAQFDCGSRPHPRFPEQENRDVSKPLLRDVIRMAEAYVEEHDRAPVYYNIETKSRPSWEGTFHPAPDTFAQRLYDVLAETGILNRAVVQSFDPRTLRATRAIDPEVRLALLVEGSMSKGLEADLEALGFIPAIYSPDYELVDAELIAAAHAKGMQVIPWTVNTADEMRALIELGVDGLITDYPNIGQEVVQEAAR